MSERDEHEREAPAAIVDEALIDATLALSPEERLRQNDRMLRTIMVVQQGLTARDPAPHGGSR